MDGVWTVLLSQIRSVFPSGSRKQIAGQLHTVLLLHFHIERATSLEIKRSAMRRFQFFIRTLRVLRIIYFISRKSVLSALLFSCLVALHFSSLHNFFFLNLFIACFSWLILTFHFSLLVLYDLLFPFFFFSLSWLLSQLFSSGALSFP